MIDENTFFNGVSYDCDCNNSNLEILLNVFNGDKYSSIILKSKTSNISDRFESKLNIGIVVSLIVKDEICRNLLMLQK